ncbi:MAG: hypothetical protein WAK31_04550 [Chthoniobacterales bacterium]
MTTKFSRSRRAGVVPGVVAGFSSGVGLGEGRVAGLTCGLEDGSGAGLSLFTGELFAVAEVCAVLCRICDGVAPALRMVFPASQQGHKRRKEFSSHDFQTDILIHLFSYLSGLVVYYFLFATSGIAFRYTQVLRSLASLVQSLMLPNNAGNAVTAASAENANHQSPLTNHHSPITSHFSLLTSH